MKKGQKILTCCNNHCHPYYPNKAQPNKAFPSRRSEIPAITAARHPNGPGQGVYGAILKAAELRMEPLTPKRPFRMDQTCIELTMFFPISIDIYRFLLHEICIITYNMNLFTGMTIPYDAFLWLVDWCWLFYVFVVDLGSLAGGSTIPTKTACSTDLEASSKTHCVAFKTSGSSNRQRDISEKQLADLSWGAMLLMSSFWVATEWA